jgi:hypothetical protein
MRLTEEATVRTTQEVRSHAMGRGEETIKTTDGATTIFTAGDRTGPNSGQIERVETQSRR